MFNKNSYIKSQHVTLVALQHGQTFCLNAYAEAVEFAIEVNRMKADTRIPFINADGKEVYTNAGSLMWLLQEWAPEGQLVVNCDKGGIRFDRTEERKRKV